MILWQKCIFHLCLQFLAHRSWNSCNFIGVLGRPFVYLVFDPGSWHRAPKFLGISWVMGESFILMRWLLERVPRWELVIRKTEPVLQAWTFSPVLHHLQASSMPMRWSLLKKALSSGTQGASKLVNTSSSLKSGTQHLQREKCLCSGTFYTSPYLPFI